MIKKIIVLAFLSFFISCGTSKSKIKTSRNSTVKTKTTSKKPHVVKTTGTSGRTTEVLESTSRTTVYSDKVKDYIIKYNSIAQDNMRRHGIPASITLAQGILESGAGNGTLCLKANNHFGIKCHTGWTGETVHHDDDAEQECFRKYKDPADSFNDHSLFLTTRNRYASLFKLPKSDYVAWAKGLKVAGYATDPKYPDKLIGLIERYDLSSYDAEVLGGSYVPVTKTTPTVQTAVAAAQTDSPLPNGSHRVQQGDTLYNISKRYNTTVDELMKINDLSSNAISIGQVLKIK